MRTFRYALWMSTDVSQQPGRSIDWKCRMFGRLNLRVRIHRFNSFKLKINRSFSFCTITNNGDRWLHSLSFVTGPTAPTLYNSSTFLSNAGDARTSYFANCDG